MSWDNSPYSFGNPNAHPPTPTQTPTSASSPVFQTPRPQKDPNDNRAEWTPTYAEEYSVFHATPGRLISHSFQDVSTPRPSTAASFKRRPSTTEELDAELTSLVHHTVNTNLPLPPVDPTRQLPSSPTVLQSTQSRAEERRQRTTPRKPSRRLEEASGGQTVTPPPSAAKGSRKLAPKVLKMQDDQESFIPPPGTPGQQDAPQFSANLSDMYSYPMTAPATAPVYNTRPFWDPDSSMGGMDMSFSVTDTTMFDQSMTHRAGGSLDWGRNNQIFPELGNSSFSAAQSQSFSMSMSEDPFAIVTSTGAVDPGLLFSFPDPPLRQMDNPDNSAIEMVPPPPQVPNQNNNQSLPIPYEHQQRESKRDQDELAKASSRRDSSQGARLQRPSRSSPVNASDRPIISRSMSENRPRRLAPKATPIPAMPEIRTPSKRRSSPLKQHQNRMSLTSIPESVPGTRTSVTFSIDENGRAHADTRIIVDEPETFVEEPPLQSVISDDRESDSYSESSSDDEPILLASRNNSFKMPTHREGPRYGHIDSSRRRRSVSDGRTLSMSSKDTREDPDSDPEVAAEATSDAALALRKVMETRKTSSGHPRRSSSQITPRNYQTYGQSSNLSPTTISEPDLATPSTDRESSISDSTRCVCNGRDGDSFMIQCESCEKWLHGNCVNIRSDRLPKVYICPYCAQTPNMRGGRIREPARGAATIGSSPLAHKSFKKSWR